MLPRHHRLVHSADFARAVRSGVRASSRHVVVHLGAGDAQTRVGLVVSKAVGPAVTRTQVKRRLRHLLAERVDLAPLGSLVVVRALSAAAGASSSELAASVDRCLDRCLARSSADHGVDRVT